MSRLEAASVGTLPAMETPEQRLAALYARAAAGPRPLILCIAVTSSGAIHHCFGGKPGDLGLVARMPHDEVSSGSVYLSVAESEYTKPVLAYLLEAAIADVEANPPAPGRTVATAGFLETDALLKPGVGTLVMSLQSNMEDLMSGFHRGAELLQRPIAEMERVPFLRGTLEQLKTLYEPFFRPTESPVAVVLRAMREKPLEEICQGFSGRVWCQDDGQLLWSLAIYLRALAQGGFLDNPTEKP